MRMPPRTLEPEDHWEEEVALPQEHQPWGRLGQVHKVTARVEGAGLSVWAGLSGDRQDVWTGLCVSGLVGTD